MKLPLDDIKVLDLCRVLPGPMCTMILGDMGAEVIKVEDIEDRGGTGRDMLTPPSPTSEVEDEALAYNHLARNKKSIALNLRDTRAREVFYELAKGADVLIESFRPGVVERLEVDYKTISALNPKLVYCSLSAYGQDSPYRELPGHEPEYCAISGALSLTGDDEGIPVIIGANMADASGGLHAAIAILCALRARDKTGEGQYLDIAIADCMLSFTGVNLGLYLRRNFVPQRGWQPPYRHIWRTKDDKFIAVTNPERHLWELFCRAISREDLIPYQRPKGDKRLEINDIIAEVMRSKTRDDWVTILRQAGVSAAPVLEINEVATESHYQHRQMRLELEHPTKGKVEQLGTPFKFSKMPIGFRSFAPSLGQHTEELMLGLGYTSKQVAEMRAAKAIK